MAVELVFTELRSELTEKRARNFARLEEQLAAASGFEVNTSFYEEVQAERLSRASAVVLSGSTTAWAKREAAPLARLGEAVRAAGKPVLGICAGMQLQARFAGGELGPSPDAEHGFLPITVTDASDLLRGLPHEVSVFQDHTDAITVLPPGFRVLASSTACAVQAIAAPGRRWWGTQFHPEEWTAEHPEGEQVLRNFFALAA